MAIYLGSNKVGGNTDVNKLPTFKNVVSGSCANTVANEWFYTTLSFTVPVGHIYLVYVSVGYNMGKPIGIGLHSSTTISSAIGAPEYTHEASYVGQSPAWLLSPGTYYLFCKRNGSSGSYTNSYAISAIDFNSN